MANLRTNNLSGEQGQNAYRGSVHFPQVHNSTDYLQIGSAGDFNFLHDGTSDWTAEFWVHPKQNNNRQTIFSTGGNSSSIGFACRIMEDGASGGSNGYKVLCQFSRGASGNYLGFLGGVIDNKDFSHVALVFTTSNKQLAIYINGQLTNSSDLDGTAEGTFGSGNFSSSNSSYALTIGRENYSTTLYLDSAFLSNLRIVEGETVYTAAFTPPTSELTIIPNTTLLCCQDSNVPTQEATGKTITANGNFADLDFVKQQPVVIPKVGVDAGNTFGGPIQQSSQGYMYFPTGRTEERGRGFVVFAGGLTPSVTSLMEYVHIPSGGNTIAFGNLSVAKNQLMAVSSRTRGIWGGGSTGSVTNTMEFVTLATTSNTSDFGDLTVARGHGGAVQNSTRGVFMTGYTPSNVNTIDFITMATTGDATDFGDVIDDGWPAGGGRSSSTRGVLMGHGDGTNRIQFITIMTTGNSQDFGDLNTSSYGVGAGEVSDGLRAVAMGGSGAPADQTNVIDFITIATTGNATDFGDLTQARRGGGVGCTLTRGILGGGRNPSDSKTIDSVIIQTTGNAIDFGDLIGVVAFNHPGCSDSHGGLT